MHTLKQGMAAVVLVMSLGLVMSSSFGGSASADPKPGSGRTEDPRWFYCDLDGNGTNETPYEVVSQGNGQAGFHDLHSSTVLVYKYDQTTERNFPFIDSTDPDAPVDDREFVDITYPIRKNNQGNTTKQQPQPVPCHEGLDEFKFAVDITACCDPLIEGAHYHVYESRTWYVTLSGDGQGAVKAASADNGKHSADRQHKAKNGGKHRSKGHHRT